MRARVQRTRRDGRETASAGPRAGQPLAEAILRLQRGAGNAVTARTIQRMVGLEYQTGVPVKGKEPLKEGAPLAAGTGWHVVADEVKGDTGVLEFVTSHFGVEEALAKAAAGAQASAQNISVEPTNTSRVWKPLSSIVPSAPAGYEYQQAMSDVTAAPQATWDVPLDRIAELLMGMRTPMLGPFGGDPTIDLSDSLSGDAPEDAKMLALCAEHVESWFEKKGRPGRKGHERLIGLASLALSYILSGAAQQGTQPYAKTIAPVLARTSFSSLWGQLSDPEKRMFDRPINMEDEDEDDWLTRDDDDEIPAVEEEENEGQQDADASDSDEDDLHPAPVIVSEGEEDEEEEAAPPPSAAENFTTWLRRLGYDLAAEHKELATPRPRVFAQGYRSEQGGETVEGPLTQDWLASIVDPKGGKDLMSPPNRGSASMGRLNATAPTAVLELRRMPKSLAVEDWTDFAKHVFGLYLKLVGEEVAQRAPQTDATPAPTVPAAVQTPKSND
jgi:hypothetical protein